MGIIRCEFSISPDIDMIPIPGMDLDLEDFLTKENAKSEPCDKCAYVIPTYEISSKNTTHMPVNKTELLTLVKVQVQSNQGAR